MSGAGNKVNKIALTLREARRLAGKSLKHLCGTGQTITAATHANVHAVERERERER